jgi:hypothetical protein
LRHYATSWKVAGSNPDEVIGFLSIDLILPPSKDNSTCCRGNTHKPGAYGSQKLKVDHEHEGQAAERKTPGYIYKNDDTPCEVK